jgi:transcriptional regulator with XRE-family HTH domain
VPVRTKSLDAISSEVARLLKEAREQRGLSLNVVLQRAGLARQTVSYVEQESQSPTLDTLLRITSVLGIELEKVIAEARNESHKMLYPVQERLNFQLSGWRFDIHTRFKHGSVNNDQPLLLSQVATKTGSIPIPWANPPFPQANLRRRLAS